ncbi:MAG TPA: hypothetical protein VK169_15225 [Saprospiraceae bacterium]|nr:hypothetical protein [Saprospiraceae bacterium]
MVTPNNNNIDLKEQFEQLFTQIMEIKIMSEDLIYLHPKNDNYNDLIFYSPLFLRMRDGLKALFALRFCNFLNNNEHYNLTSFVNYLIKNYDNITFENMVDLKEIEKCKDKISKIKNSPEHKTLLHIRNKHLAHIDKDRAKTNLKEVFQDDIDKVIGDLVEIFKFLGNKLFDTSFNMEIMYWDKDHNILHQMSSYYDVMKLYEGKKYNSISQKIELKEIEDILKKH